MPWGTPAEKRDRAVIAFTILSGARDGALASFRLKHVELAARTIFQNGRDVKTKGRKTLTSSFFPVGPEPLAIVADYLRMLTQELGFGPDEPLFPSTLMAHDTDRNHVAQGLSRKPWSGAQPVRRILAKAFAAGTARLQPAFAAQDAGAVWGKAQADPGTRESLFNEFRP